MTQTLWKSSKSSNERFNQLRKYIDVDVCVIGAGIAGVINAYLLAKTGRSVALIDSGEISNGATIDTTAHITWVLDQRYHKLCETYGNQNTKLIAQSHRKAIENIAKIIKDEKIDCNFEWVSGFLFAAQPDEVEEKNETYWDQELYTLRNLGFTDIHSLSTAPLASVKTGPAIEFTNQAQFHPIKFIHGLISVLKNLGVQIYTNSRVVNIQGESPVFVETEDKGMISTRAAIIATNSPINNIFRMHTKQSAYQSYVIAMRIPRFSHSRALYWDDLDPYHYVRFAPSEDYDLMIVGGEDHKTGQENDADDRFARLERWARVHFSQAGEVEYRWCGQVLEPIDDLAFIGRNPGNKNIYIATGFSGNGMTYGMISGLILKDLIDEKHHAWENIYDPSRITLHAAGEFAKENLNVAWQMSDWVKSGDVEGVDDIANNEGAVVRQGLKMLAVYKDESGQVSSYSAKCPHLGCIVHWNAAAKTWDCPCHGSRFSCHGEVITGPTTKDLQEEKDTATPILLKKSEVHL